MFPRDRVMQSLQKYKIEFSESETTEELRDKLADFYAQRTLTKRPDPAAGLRCRDRVAGRRSERKDNRPRHSRRRRPVRSLSSLRSEYAARLLCVAGQARAARGIQRSVIAKCGPRCKPLCGKPDGATIRCSCATTAFSSAILRLTTSNARAPAWRQREVNERWQREMGDFFVQPDGVLPDRAMQPLEEVFHL